MMYILSEEEYQHLKNSGSASATPQDLNKFIEHFAFYQCGECGRIVAMQKSSKDSLQDLKTLALGCPGCGENVSLYTDSVNELMKAVLAG